MQLNKRQTYVAYFSVSVMLGIRYNEIEGDPMHLGLSKVDEETVDLPEVAELEALQDTLFNAIADEATPLK